MIYYPGGHAWKPILGFILPRSAITILTVHDPELHSGEDTLSFRLLAAVNRLRVYGYVLLNNVAASGLHREAPSAPDVGRRDSPWRSSTASSTLAPRSSTFDELADLEPLTGRFALFVGRIQRYKGIDTLLTAYLEIPEDLRMPLVIAGSGEFSPAETELLDSIRPGDDVHVVNRWLSDRGDVVAGGSRAVRRPPVHLGDPVRRDSARLGVRHAGDRLGHRRTRRAGRRRRDRDAVPGRRRRCARAATMERAFALSEADYLAMSERAREYAERELVVERSGRSSCWTSSRRSEAAKLLRDP